MVNDPLLDGESPSAVSVLSNQGQRNYSRLTLISYATGPLWITLCHLGMLLALVTGLSIGAWIWVFGLYWLRMLATTAIYHRLLTHKAYSSPTLVKWIGSLVAASAGQMGPSWWKSHHEAHHHYTDRSGDPHSPTRGFWWSHYRWLVSQNTFPTRLPADIEQDIVLKTIDRFHFVPLIALGGVSYLIGGLEYVSAFFISTTLLFHGVALVNSVCHTYGTSPFKTDDYSRNNWIVAVLALGEGWHNFHHAFPWAARQGVTVSEGKIKPLTDITYLFIQGLQRLGLASKIRQPAAEHVLALSKEDL
jgi:stearoyl-CoA desaturase (delta-9 desaturase)